MTEVLTSTLRLNASDAAHIARAAAILRAGGTVAFPTETVYGLGANALDPAAVEKIFIAKQRPHWDPLILHIAEHAQLPQLAAEIAAAAKQLMDAFWPGPLTILLPRTPAVPSAVTAGRPLVGVRIPAHPVALALLRAAGVPIAAPSANTFGHTSPTTAAHVLADLDGRIDAVLDGGPTAVGVESTVVEILPGKELVIYRAGAVDQGMIEAVLDRGWWVHPYESVPDHREPAEALPSPGVGIRHYAPRARLILVDDESSLSDTVESHGGHRVGVLLPEHWYSAGAESIFHWGPWHQPETLAERLYAGLRQLDDEGSEVIVCPVPRGLGIAEAIRDRLRKAARS